MKKKFRKIFKQSISFALVLSMLIMSAPMNLRAENIIPEGNQIEEE